MIYTVTCNPAIDYVVFLEQFAAGSLNRTRREAVQFGGKGVNVSLMLGKLGVKSTALGFSAGFTGKALEEFLQENGVSAEFVHLEKGLTRINVKIKAEEETEINGQGPEIDETAQNALFAKLDRMKQGDTLVLAGSIPASLPGDLYERILSRYSGKGIRFAVDATGELLVNCVKHHPFVIKPNHIELGEIFGRQPKNDAEIAADAKKLQKMGAQNVLVSMAGEGAILLDAEGSIHRIGALKGKVVNSVGAGDSMLAGFLAGIDRGYDFALKLGTASGGATAFSEGLGEAKEIEQFLKEL